MSKVFIVGYSLEACYVAAKLSAEGADVVFYKTGTLGYPCDDIRDYMDQSSYDAIGKYVRNMSELVSPKVDPIAYYSPYDELKITNDSNGLVNYPLRRSSFETISEYEIFRDKMSAVSDITSLAEQSSNALFIYKKYMPRNVFDSLFKDHGSGKWGGVLQYNATMLAREIPINYSTYSGPLIYYRAHSYESLCESLLSNVNIVEYSLDRVKSDLRRRIHGKYIIMDNRIDFICNYMHGRVSRVVLNKHSVPIDMCDEFRCRKDVSALRFSHPEYWLSYAMSKSAAIRVSSERVRRLSFSGQSMVVPSVQSYDILSAYGNLVGMYSGKAFSLPTPMTILA